MDSTQESLQPWASDRPYRLTGQQFTSIVGAQRRLNSAYHGDRWKTDPATIQYYNAAADEEVSEFLHEVTMKWKWHSARPKFNREAALFEMVDAIHFMMAGFVAALETLPLEPGEEYARDIKGENLVISNDNWYEHMSRFYRSFWTSCYEMKRLSQDPSSASKYYLLVVIDNAVSSLIQYAEVGASLLLYSGLEVYQAYMLKNERNRERVNKGVMQGVDVKKDEEALCLPPR